MHTSSEAEAARHFGIPRTTIRGWKGLDKQPVDRTRKKSHAKKGKNKAGAGRPLSYNEDIDMELCQWILEMCDLHLPVQRKHVQRKAMALIQPTQPSFKASAGWLQNVSQTTLPHSAPKYIHSAEAASSIGRKAFELFL